MYVLKGFAQHGLLANNAPNVVNAIGELSTMSMTYSKQGGTYTSPEQPNVTLQSFLCASDGVATALDPDIKNQVLTIVGWLYKTSLGAGGAIFADDILKSLISQFSNFGSNFTAGQIVSDGKYYMPEFISWSASSKPGSLIKIWFSDDAFQREYDEFEIIVIPPITPLDTFFTTAQNVKKVMAATTYGDKVKAIQTAKAGYPETIIQSLNFMYHDPNNKTTVVGTDWMLLIYGAAGNNVDAIKDALVKYILSNSTHSRDEWTVIFPDIFKRTEFVIVPNWNSYAIPDKSIEAGVYRGMANLNSSLQTLAAYTPDYPQSHINAHATVMNHPYRCLALNIIGSNENRDQLYELSDIFPDIIPVSSKSQDFNRMTADTREFMERLSEMLMIAESMNEYTAVGANYTKTTRNGHLFIVLSLLNVHFLVAAKKTSVK